MKNIIFKTYIVWAIITSSCKEDNGITAARIGEKPSSLTNLKSEEIAGGAIISYDLPSTPDLRYVKGIYTLENGRMMTAKGSVYNNQLVVEGFAEEGNYDVELRAVSVGEVESDPVTVKIKTGKPFYKTLSESFNSDDLFISTFGGVNLKYTNEKAANIILRLYKYQKDSATNKYNWTTVNETYTKAKSGIVRVRGEKPIESLYGVVVRDQWGNVSDTIKKNLTPFEENEFLPIKIYKGIVAYSIQNKNGDYVINVSQGNSAAMDVSLFDSSVGANGVINRQKMWWGKAAPVPMQFSIDLGKPAQVSRIKMWPRNDNNDNLYFQATHVKEFELYGSNNPAADGSWDTWSYIGTFESIRPSGLAFGTNANQEDITYINQGEDFEVNWEQPGGYQYFRIKINCTWNGVRDQELGNAFTIAISELKFFGKFIK